MLGIFQPALFLNGKKYKLISQIGEGAFGFVYSVRSVNSDDTRNKQYAIKKMICQTPEQIAEAKKEIDLMIRIQHPNILPLLDFSYVKNKQGHQEVSLLLPLYHASAQSVVERGNDYPYCSFHDGLDVIKILRHCTEGLLAIHASNFRHADFKPGNILLNKEFDAVIIDFGSAMPLTQVVNSRTDMLEVQDKAATFTTAPYRSPELFDPVTGMTIDGKADVWAFGCTMYCLFFSRSPFESQYDGFSSLSVLNAQYTIPDSTQHNWPEDYIELLQGCLQVDLQKRLSMAEVQSRLKRLSSPPLELIQPPKIQTMVHSSTHGTHSTHGTITTNTTTTIPSAATTPTHNTHNNSSATQTNKNKVSFFFSGNKSNNSSAAAMVNHKNHQILSDADNDMNDLENDENDENDDQSNNNNDSTNITTIATSLPRLPSKGQSSNFADFNSDSATAATAVMFFPPEPGEEELLRGNNNATTDNTSSGGDAGQFRMSSIEKAFMTSDSNSADIFDGILHTNTATNSTSTTTTTTTTAKRHPSIVSPTSLVSQTNVDHSDHESEEGRDESNASDTPVAETAQPPTLQHPNQDHTNNTSSSNNSSNTSSIENTPVLSSISSSIVIVDTAHNTTNNYDQSSDTSTPLSDDHSSIVMVHNSNANTNNHTNDEDDEAVVVVDSDNLDTIMTTTTVTVTDTKHHTDEDDEEFGDFASNNNIANTTAIATTTAIAAAEIILSEADLLQLPAINFLSLAISHSRSSTTIIKESAVFIMRLGGFPKKLVRKQVWLTMTPYALIIRKDNTNQDTANTNTSSSSSSKIHHIISLQRPLSISPSDTLSIGLHGVSINGYTPLDPSNTTSASSSGVVSPTSSLSRRLSFKSSSNTNNNTSNNNRSSFRLSSTNSSFSAGSSSNNLNATAAAVVEEWVQVPFINKEQNYRKEYVRGKFSTITPSIEIAFTSRENMVEWIDYVYNYYEQLIIPPSPSTR